MRDFITYKLNKCAEDHGIKKLKIPDYHERVDKLNDAIRVMDKLSNKL